MRRRVGVPRHPDQVQELSGATPCLARARADAREPRRGAAIKVFGRLAPGVTEAQANLGRLLMVRKEFGPAQAAVRANKPMLDKLGLTYPQFIVMMVLDTALA